MTTTKKNIFDSCNVYIMLWIAQHVQNAFLDSSLVSMLFYIPLSGMTFYYAVKSYLYPTRGFMKILSVFFFILVLYGIGLLVLDNATGQVRYSFLQIILSSLGPIFAFYEFAKQGRLTEQRMLFWLLFFVAVATLEYFVNEQNKLKLLAQQGSTREEITNNLAYGILGLFPFVFLLRKKTLFQYFYLGYISYFVFHGLKRGAIITILFMIAWYVYVVTRSKTRFRRIGFLGLTVVFCLIAWNYINKFYETSEYFQLRVEDTREGVDSNRNVIYSTLWYHYLQNDNILQLAFGEGAYHTETLIGLKAHNDWLELLIDCGLFGVIIYFFYWVYFIRDWIRSKNNIVIFAMLGACLIYTFMRTLFSMSFTDIPFSVCMIMGYCFASMNNNTRVLLSIEK